MKNVNLTMILLSILLTSSCVNENTLGEKGVVQKINNELDIKMPKYISMDVDEGYAIGDYTMRIDIFFDSVNFNLLVAQVEEKVIEDALQNAGRGSSNTVEPKWVKYYSGYKIEKHNVEQNEKSYYYLCLSKNSLGYLYVIE